MPLPSLFCWTRFGVEAGESIGAILARKDAERAANDGVFYWGIGNSVAPAMLDLTREVQCPEVLFSPIKSRPRAVDVSPPSTVVWTRAEGLDGSVRDLPPSVRVTSRGGRSSHYALVCCASEPLELADHGSVRFDELVNLQSGRPLGASQVTAVVQRLQRQASVEPPAGAEYVVALRAQLVAPFFVRLRQPETAISRQSLLIAA